MDALLDAPAFVVVALTLASALLLIEVALPTFGIAGISGFVLGGAGAASVARQDKAWWPLVLVALAVCLWAVLVARRSAPPAAQVTAAVLYALGGIGYGIAAGDIPAIVVAGLATAGLAAGFPTLVTASNRLLNRPSQVGMDSLVGRVAVVERAAGRAGTVRLEGSLWNATSSAGDLPGPGETVLVAGYDGMMLVVTPVAVRPS